MAKPVCCVADQFCVAHANLEPRYRPWRLAKCARCDEDVCSKCSARLPVKGKAQRICHHCMEKEDGNDIRVMKRLHRMAGVPYVSAKKLGENGGEKVA